MRHSIPVARASFEAVEAATGREDLSTGVTAERRAESPRVGARTAFVPFCTCLEKRRVRLRPDSILSLEPQQRMYEQGVNSQLVFSSYTDVNDFVRETFLFKSRFISRLQLQLVTVRIR